MSVNVSSEIKKTGSAIASKVKQVAKPATTEGVATNFVGYMLSIPLSFGYDFLYDLLAKKVITNPIASDVLKVLLPAGVGAIFQFGKLPLGDAVAGIGYGIAIMSLIKIAIRRFKLMGKKTVTTATEPTTVNPTGLWGIEGT